MCILFQVHKARVQSFGQQGESFTKMSRELISRAFKDWQYVWLGMEDRVVATAGGSCAREHRDDTLPKGPTSSAIYPGQPSS